MRSARRSGSIVSVGRAPQERRCGGEPAAGLRPARRALELGRDVLVRASRGLRAVPGAAIRLERGVGRVRQRPVRAPALGIRGRPIDGRPHQRMPEAHLRADIQQPGPRRGSSAVPAIPSRVAARHISAGSPRGSAAATRSSSRVSAAAPRAAAGSSPRSGPTAAAAPAARTRRQLRRREPARELQQRKRIAARLGDDPVPDALIEPARDDRREQGAGVLVVESFEQQLRQARELASSSGRAPRTRAPPTPPAAAAPRSPGPGARRRRATERRRRSRAAAAPPRPRRAGSAPRGDQEAVGRIAGGEAERDAQGRCWGWKPVEPGEHRRAELMEPRERQLHLGFDPAIRATRNPEASSRSAAAAPSCRCRPRPG